MIEVSLTVNGERVQRSVPARLNLADFLRNELELTGTTSAASTACAARAPCASTARSCAAA